MKIKLLLFSIIAFCAFTVSAQESTVRGRVVDGRTGKPIHNAVVVVGADQTYTVKTDANGEFLLAGVGPRPYSLVVSAHNFKARKVTGSPGEITLSYSPEEDSGVTGRVTLREGRAPVEGAKITLQGMRQYDTVTDATGTFLITGVEPGMYTARVEAPDMGDFEQGVRVGDFVRDMGLFTLAPRLERTGYDEADFEEFEFDFLNSGRSESMPALLSSSKDVFDNVAGFNFGSVRFRTRGYDSGNTMVYLNGIYFNDALTGYSPWSLWSGLNEATRDQESTNGLEISDYGVGGIGGTTNINARASKMRKGWRTSFVNANNNYRFRFLASYSSGESDKGWSYAFNVSTRQGGNDWSEGTWTNGWAYFGSVEKKINRSNRIALTAFGAPTQRAVQGASTQEVYDMVGSNTYNSNWGYQGGTKRKDQRNARVRDNHEPVVMLNWYHEPSERTKVTASVSYRFGRNGYSALDWYDAADPRPDYYRNLPSYYLSGGSYSEDPETGNPDGKYDPDKAAWLYYGWKTDWGVRQINWQNLYDVNRKSALNEDADYWGNPDVAGKGYTRSKYVLEERRTDQQDFNAKVQLVSWNRNDGRFAAGVEYRWNRTEYYKKIKDLLGGDYFVDIDNFADRESGADASGSNQNDLDRPNRLLKKGDKYGYDYYAHVRKDKVWATYEQAFGRWIMTLGFENGHTKFWREGRVRKGLFPNNSKGDSDKLDFWTYTAKAGLKFRLNGANTIYANFASLRQAPYFQNAFVAPRSRNSVVDGATTEKIMSADLNYALRLPDIKLRVTGFYTRIDDRMKVTSFYDDTYRQMTNFAMKGIDQIHTGVEGGIRVPVIPKLSATGVFSYGYYKYASNPYMTQTVDNSEEALLVDERIWWKDMKVEGTPQTAASLGLEWSGFRNMWIGVNANYFDAMYLSMNPLYRTDRAHQNLTYEQSQAMAKQEMFDRAFVLNANLSKLWYINGNMLGLSLQVNNILNDKDIKTGGYEQTRLRKVNTVSDPGSQEYGRFDSRYYYMFGTTYYLNIYYRF